ncbi:MAG TPA: glycosyltransferase, partial [Candidatus Binataceae bacterium]|nr:glycosyltransferase [Candidatus Binataceae bacterium]
MNLAGDIALRERKPVVMTTVPYYLPGFKGGGKLFTVRNLVAGLSSRFHFKVLTADRDLGDARTYPGISANQWIASGNCEIFYADAQPDSMRSVCAQLSRTDYDILHLNSIFSRRFGIAPLMLRRFGRIPPRPMIVAPRGELAAGALAIKSARKKVFLATARKLGLFEGAIWQATSYEEAIAIRRIIGDDVPIAIAPDLLSAEYRKWKASQYRKRRGKLDIVFLSRIAPNKNLHLAIDALRGLEGDVTFRIAGPIDDWSYWARCQKSIGALGANVRVEYLGPLIASEVAACFGRHGLFFLPTANENFGFVILEALLAGCPVLLSEQTPWRNLARHGVGWDLPLYQPDLMRAALRDV